MRTLDCNYMQNIFIYVEKLTYNRKYCHLTNRSRQPWLTNDLVYFKFVVFKGITFTEFVILHLQC